MQIKFCQCLSEFDHETQTKLFLKFYSSVVSAAIQIPSVQDFGV